ncbi:hypothetical protein MPH_11697 [Macrophomina phaseolina MS6]|uniref:Uncharacterized protein n=1 Tax=Macrophomina phaseolina (strain MS6) TaxID=1126212 RepID=K2QMV3_MACPH|nr:hypothetical protein MPH_11697 [Macrophomina phaseolina MS6]
MLLVTPRAVKMSNASRGLWVTARAFHYYRSNHADVHRRRYLDNCLSSPCEDMPATSSTNSGVNTLFRSGISFWYICRKSPKLHTKGAPKELLRRRYKRKKKKKAKLPYQAMKVQERKANQLLPKQLMLHPQAKQIIVEEKREMKIKELKDAHVPQAPGDKPVSSVKPEDEIIKR